jgi:hypothetical protein
MSLMFFCLIAPPISFAKQIVNTSHGSVVITWDNIEAVVKGEHLRAILAAYEDFSKKVSPSMYAKELREYGADSMPVYAAQIENYNIEVRTGSEGYTVVFRLKHSDAYPRFMGAGGETQYIVDAKMFKAIKVESQK